MKKYSKPEIEIVKLADSLMGDVNIGIGSAYDGDDKLPTGAKDHQDTGLFSTDDQQDDQQKPVWE